MTRHRRIFPIVGVVALLAGTAGCGATGVYVGVAVPGPWVGYPGYYPPPTMIGRPPVYWDDDEEDADVDAAAARTEAAALPVIDHPLD